MDSALVDFFWLFGALWAAAMFYLFLSTLLVDIVRLGCWWLWKKPALLFSNYVVTKFIAFCVVTGVTIIILSVGYYHATRPQVNTVELDVHKYAGKLNSLNIVAASDLHLGTINGRANLQRWVNGINSLQPDIVLLAGDVFDDNPSPVERKQLGLILEQIKAPMGVYFASGNHEIYGNLHRATAYLSKHYVIPLLDQAVLIDSSFYVIGRLDHSHGPGSQAKTERKSLKELMEGLDDTKPIIVMDHQPLELEKAAQAAIDIQVSGHTHKGQIWPFSFITKQIYTLDGGYMKKGNSHFFVSQGLGTWGPPVRIGTRSEIVQLKVSFKPD